VGGLARCRRSSLTLPLSLWERGGIVNLLSGLSRVHLVCHTRGMNTPSINPYKNHRFPVEIISHAVWLYFRFCLSYRDVEELLFSRGILVTYEAIRVRHEAH
jgi:hypothetical protein